MTEKKQYKIEGENFDKINAIFKRLEELYNEKNEMHAKVWEIIKEAVPETNTEDQNHHLITDYIKLGFFIVEETEECGCENCRRGASSGASVGGILGAILRGRTK